MLNKLRNDWATLGMFNKLRNDWATLGMFNKLRNDWATLGMLNKLSDPGGGWRRAPSPAPTPARAALLYYSCTSGWARM